MTPKISHKIIAACGMAVVIGIGVATFFLRSPPATPAAAAIAATDSAAGAPAALPEAAAPVEAVPAASAPPPAVPAPVAPTETVSTRARDSAVLPAVDAKPTHHQQAVAVAGAVEVTNPKVARSEGVVATTEAPKLDESVARVDAASDSNTAPMTAMALDGNPQTQTSVELAASDTQITSDVKSAIAGEGLGKDSSIGVTTTHGVVALTGSAASQDAIDQVRDVARKVKDVKSVDTSALILASL